MEKEDVVLQDEFALVNDEETYFALSQSKKDKSFEIVATGMDEDKPVLDEVRYKETFAHREDAWDRYLEVLDCVSKGYKLDELPPKGISFVVGKAEIDGIKVTQEDVVALDELGSPCYIAKFGQAAKEEKVIDWENPYKKEGDKAHGFVKYTNEEGKSVWKSQELTNDKYPVKSMYRAALVENAKKDKWLVRNYLDRKSGIDVVNIRKPFAFTRSVSDDKIVIDIYRPERNVKGIYSHEMEVFKNGHIWEKVKYTQREVIPWKTFKEKVNQEFKQIQKAKDLGLLAFPSDTAHLSAKEVAGMALDPNNHYFGPKVRELTVPTKKEEVNAEIIAKELEDVRTGKKEVRKQIRGIHRRRESEGRSMTR